MIENGGSIINVTSDAGVTGYPGWCLASPNLDSKVSQTWQQNLKKAMFASIGLIQAIWYGDAPGG